MNSEKTKTLKWGGTFGIILDGQVISKAKMPWGIVIIDRFYSSDTTFIKSLGIDVETVWGSGNPHAAEITKAQFFQIIKHHDEWTKSASSRGAADRDEMAKKYQHEVGQYGG